MKQHKLWMIVLMMVFLVLVSSSVSALSQEETVSELVRIFDEVGAVETGIDETIIPLLQRFKYEYSLDAVRVDDQGTIFFATQYYSEFEEGTSVYYDVDEEKLLRKSDGEKLLLFFEGDYFLSDVVVNYDSLYLDYSGVIEYPFEILFDDTRPVHIDLSVGPQTEAELVLEDGTVLANIANPSFDKFQDYAFIPKISNFFSEEFTRKVFGEPVLLQSTKVDTTNAILPDKYLGKDYSMYNIIDSFSVLSGQGNNPLVLDSHGLSRKGVFFKENNTLYEFGFLAQHQRFLYPKVVQGNNVNVYSESLRGNLITYAVPRFLIADDGYAYLVNYSSIISGKTDIIIIDFNLAYIHKDTVFKDVKGDSQLVSLLSTPGGNPLLLLKELYNTLNLSSHQFLSPSTESKEGKMQLYDQFYEGDFIQKDPTGIIFYDNVYVGTQYMGEKK